MVTVTPDTVIRHGNRRFEFSELSVGDRVHVRAARVTSTGSGALASASTLEAQEIMLQNPGDGDDGEEPSALVSVAAFDASASETPANPGSFRLTRAGTLTQLASALTVSFTLNVILDAHYGSGALFQLGSPIVATVDLSDGVNPLRVGDGVGSVGVGVR